MLPYGEIKMALRVKVFMDKGLLAVIQMAQMGIGIYQMAMAVAVALVLVMQLVAVVGLTVL